MGNTFKKSKILVLSLICHDYLAIKKEINNFMRELRLLDSLLLVLKEQVSGTTAEF